MTPDHHNPLKSAIGRRIESAGRPATNLNYRTMQLVMAEARRMAERRERRVRYISWCVWILMAAFGIYTIIHICGASMRDGFSGIVATIANPEAWNSPSAYATITLGLIGLAIVICNCLLGPVYDRLMLRALMKHTRRH